jgi:hypothetical protein
MPYVSVRAGMPVSGNTADFLQKEIGRLIEILPGKNIDNCITEIAGDCNLYVSGKQANAVFCEARLYKPAPADKKKQFCEALHALFIEQLKAGMVYINILEFEHWCADGEYLT